MAEKKAEETTALEKRLSSADAWLADPDDVTPSGGTAGREGIGIDDVRFPRLAIAQGLSPQIASDNPINGLKLYDMFNDLTNEIYGRGPLLFVPVRRDVRYIEFRPRDEGGGVLDLDVPPNDPRTQWTTTMEGNEKVRVAPRATKFVEFVVLLLREEHDPEPIVLSIKDTNKWNRKAHTDLTTIISLQNDDIYGRIYKVSSRPEKNDSGTFGVYSVELFGKASSKLRENAKAMYESLKGKKIVVDRDGATEDEEAAAGAAAEEGKEPIPF